MTRTRASAKTAGTRFAQGVCTYLAYHLGDDRIERRDKNGAKDRGDVTGVRHMGQRVVLECKDVARMALGEWITEAETERRHDDAGVGMVVHKRRGYGNAGAQYVTMTVDDLISLMTGTRPEPTP